MSNPYTDKALSLPGVVAAWGQDRAADIWRDDSTNSLDLTAIGATWTATGGPGDALPSYWSLDGVDDLLRRPAHDAALNLGVSGDGAHWIAFWARRTGIHDEAWAGKVTKGDGTYQVRATAASADLRYDVRGGTGGNVGETVSAVMALDEWVFVVAQQETDPDVIAIYSGSVAAAPALGVSRPRSGTVGTDDGSTFVVGAQDNSGTLRRFFRGDFVGVAVGTGAFLNEAQRDELWASSFEEPSEEPEFDPANLAVTIDGTTAQLSWDASPLLSP